MLELSGIGLAAAFAGGAISFLSPCVLPLVPGYVSYVTGRALDTVGPADAITAVARLPILGLSLCFVLGFSTVFVALGASATALGQLLLKYRYEANIVGGIIVIVFGLFLTGLLRLPWLQREFRFHSTLKGGHPLASCVLGIGFAFGWTPCIGPVLGAILTVSAVSATASNGIALLGVYSLGLGLPFLLTALFADAMLVRLKSMRHTGRVLQTVAGAVMVAMGVAMVTGYMSAFAYWLLEFFPDLGTIG
jgi:cytochrome c-type biogenesis protein